jgi:hypothetical protein
MGFSLRPPDAMIYYTCDRLNCIQNLWAFAVVDAPTGRMSGSPPGTLLEQRCYANKRVVDSLHGYWGRRASGVLFIVQIAHEFHFGPRWHWYADTGKLRHEIFTGFMDEASVSL